MDYMRTSQNFIRTHKRQAAVSVAFVTGYTGICYNARTWKNDILRIGVAGSIANMLVETSFHVIDTVNIRSKAQAEMANKTTFAMVKGIYMNEGVYGFAKGFSACFYGACFCGFIYFSAYKWLKGVFRERFGKEVEMGIICLTASLTAELITLSV